MATNLVASLLTQIAGGAGAIALDQAKPDWAYPIPGTGAAATATTPARAPIVVTPGAMAGLATAAVLAFMPKASGESAKMVQRVAADLAGGAIVAEGTMLATNTIVPAIKGLLGVQQGMPVPAPLMAGVYGLPQGQPSVEAVQALGLNYAFIKGSLLPGTAASNSAVIALGALNRNEPTSAQNPAVVVQTLAL